MRKILHIVNGGCNKSGGGSEYIKNLFQSIKQFEHLLLCFKDNIESQYKNVSLIKIDPLIKYDKNNINKYIALLKEFTNDFSYRKQQIRHLCMSNYDLVNIHGISFFKGAKWFSRILGIAFYRKFVNYLFSEPERMVLTLHNLFSTQKPHTIENQIYNYYIEKCNNIICVDKHIYEYVIDYAAQLKTSKNIWFVPNCIDTDIFKPVNKHHKKQFSIGFSGRWADTTDLNLIESLVSKLPTDILFKMAIAGEIDKNALLKLNKPNVEINFNLGTKQLVEFYNSLNILINPILHKAITRTTLESMACGVPVMMYDYPTRSPFFDSQNGIDLCANPFPELISRISYFFSNQESLASLGENARNTILDNYSNHIIMPKIFLIYDAILN